MSKFGFIEFNPFTWVIPDFMQLPKTGKSPAFFIEDHKFFFGFYETATGEVLIWLERLSKLSGYLEIDLFSLELIGTDGTQLNICSKRRAEFLPDQRCLYGNVVGDAEISKQELSPNFLHDGNLKIRLEINVKSNHVEQDCVLNQLRRLIRMLPRHRLTRFLSKLISLKHKGLSEEEVNNCQSLHVVLGCGNSEIPVHQVLLTSRSPIFATMFSEDAKPESKVLAQVSTD